MKKFCSICGSVLDSKTGICPNCTDAKTGIYNGNISDWHNNVSTNGNGSEDKKKKIITIVAIVVAISILLGIFGVGGYLIGRGKNSLPNAYSQVVEMYKQILIDENSDGNQLSGALVNKIRESDDYEISYSYIDINDDETKELIVGGSEKGSESVEIYDVFTMDEEENAVQLFNVANFNDDTEIVIYNEVIKVSEEKEETSHFEYLKLPENQWEVEKDEEYLYEDSTYYEVNDGDKVEISQEAFDEADNKYEGEELDLEWVKVVIEEDVKEKDDNATALTEAQIKSFEKFLSDSYEELFYIQKYTSDVYSLTNCHFFGFSVYRHYFDTEPKRVTNETNRYFYMEYDAQEILFILNDVYGLNISESSSDDVKYYFDSGKYYCISATGGENQEPVNLHNLVIDSQSKLDDGYFKIEFTYTTSYDTVINSQSTDKGYFVVKPATHEKYGDYWKIKDFNMFVDFEATTTETTTETTTRQPETTTKSQTPSNSGTMTAAQLRKSIVGSWGVMNEYTFEANGKCYFFGDKNNPGTYKITDDKTLIINFPWTRDKYVWSSLSFDEFHKEHDNDEYFWYFPSEDDLRLNGTSYYRDGTMVLN